MFCITYIQKILRSKAVRLQAWSGPEGSGKLRFPDFVTTAQDGGKVVSLTHRPPLPPGNVPGTHFSWRPSRPQGHSAIGRILYPWKIPMTPGGLVVLIRKNVLDWPAFTSLKAVKNRRCCAGNKQWFFSHKILSNGEKRKGFTENPKFTSTNNEWEVIRNQSPVKWKYYHYT